MRHRLTAGGAATRRFSPASGLCEATLRRSQDAHVEKLFAGTPAPGAPLVAARFPRVFIDPDRAPFELDPAMFAEPLPRVARGLSDR